MSDQPLTVVMGRFGAVIACGLRQVLGQDRTIDVIEFDLDSAALEAAISKHAPDVAIVDEAAVLAESLPARLRETSSSVGLVVLASSPTRAYGMRLLSLGATACLPHHASSAEVLRTVHLAAGGSLVLACASELPGERLAPRLAVELTPRERDVFRCLSGGQKNAEIALQLSISLETVRTHAANIYRKLGVRSRHELHGIDAQTS